MVRQAEEQSSVAFAGNNVAMIGRASGLPEVPLFTAGDATRCLDEAYRFCRDLTQSEFRVTSLRFMVPEVSG